MKYIISAVQSCHCLSHFLTYMLFYRKSAIIAVKQLHTPWEKRQQIRMERKLMKVYEKELKDETKKRKEVENIF